MTSSDYRRQARNALRNNWGTAVVVCLLLGILAGSGSFNINLDFTDEQFAGFWQRLPHYVRHAVLTGVSYTAGAASLLSIVRLALGGAMQMGGAKYFLKLHDGQDARIDDLFSQLSRFGDGLVMHLLRSLYITLWSLLFFIPGIVASYSYAMAPYILMEDPNCSGSEALKRSKELMYGHRAELFFLDWSFFGWSVLSVLTLGIGSLWLNPYTAAAKAAFYRNLTRPRQYDSPEF